MVYNLEERQGLRGVYNILTTPFTPDYSVDKLSLRRLAEATVAMGVDGITILGVAGEAQKLTAEERSHVTAVVLEVVAGRVPTFVGTSHDGTDATIAASLAAEAAGAAGVMIAPPTNLQPGPGLTEHYRRVAAAIEIPIILQDYPPVNGVTMIPPAMADLLKAVPQITTIKLEGSPTAQRIARTRDLLDVNSTIVGGLGGVYLLDELRRGSSGAMTGFGYPEILIQIWNNWNAGDQKKAMETYYRYLPLLVFEGQPGIGLAIRKEILRKRGLIDSPVVRQPGPQLDKAIVEDLSAVMTSLEVQSTFKPFSA